MWWSSGFFFSKIFTAIGQALGKLFKAIGNAFKSLLRNPIVRSILQIVACGFGVPACVAASGALTALAGGSLEESLKAAAFAWISAGVWDTVGAWLTPMAGDFGGLTSVGFGVVKGVVHGVVGGALSVAQGGTFMEGFASNAIGGIAGVLSQGVFGKFGTGGMEKMFARTAVAAAAGCAGASLTGGKCANGAVTAAFAHMYNAVQPPNSDPGIMSDYFVVGDAFIVLSHAPNGAERNEGYGSIQPAVQVAGIPGSYAA